MKLKLIAAIWILFQSTGLFAQQKLSSSPVQPSWMDLGQEPQRDNRQIIPAEYRTVGVDVHQLRTFLFDAPHEKNVTVRASSYVITLPKPDGTMASFTLVEAPVMAPELQTMFPEIRSYAGQGIEDRTATLRMDITQFGMHAQVLSQSGTWYVDPYSPSDDEVYISYTKEAFYANTNKLADELPPVMPDEMNMDAFEERVDMPQTSPKHGKGQINIMGMLKTTSGATLRTYRLALACTGEYSVFHGGTVANSMAAMTTTMTRVNGVYEKEVSVRMVMVANNSNLVYLNGATDPYTNNNGSTMLGENQSNCNAVIGSANYDIGHVFSTGGGGVAALQSVCSATNKARGVTGSGAPVGDAFDIDYVAHEMGHQFGGNHTQNNPCNRASSAAYEPGSASTIMGYAGICPPDLQPHSDDYFHNKSYNEIISFSVSGGGNGCAVQTATGNTPPTVEAGTGGWTIPISTPFELTATASDANGDLITYCWEQFDLGPATAAGDNTLTNPSGNQPIFRSWLGTTDPTRVFPRLSDLVNNTIVLGEHMPTYDRNLSFKCTVRDNRVGGGGVADDQLTFAVDNIGGPFIVTAPNTAVTWVGNTSQTVTWNVANTTAAPINCANVNIYLSLDGGFTYPILVLSNTPNDGTQSITVPNFATTQARIKVKASNNIFFDISNVNFTITSGGGGFAEDIQLSSIISPTGSYCGDTFDPEITVTNLGTATITSFTVLYNVDGGANSNYNWVGSLAPGATVNVVLPTVIAAGGAHTFNVTLTNPNGTTDDNPANDTGSTPFTTISNATTVTLTLLTDCWGDEVSWNIENASNVILYSQGASTLGNQTTYTSTFCLAPGCYDFNIFDAFGDGLAGIASGCPINGNYTITDENGSILVQMGSPNYGAGTSHNFCVPVGPGVDGCTDSLACNYDPLATVNNGTCTYPGCLDPFACNYNATAGCSGTCTYGPINDACGNATLINAFGVAVSSTNVGTCIDGPTPSCGGAGAIKDVWYKFNYTGGNISIVTALGTNTDTRLAVWTACGGTQIACDDDAGPGNASLINLNCGTIIPGNTYYIQAGGFNSITGTFTLTVSVTNISGCTNPLATNYNSCANVNDGSCIIPGCTDAAACNYNSAATQNNGTCTYPGCMDPSACNYNATAGCSNGSCTYPGCNDPAACNYNAAAGCSNGTCTYPGCTNPAACNYVAAAGCDNGSCTLPGCINPAACNYSATAGCDNGTCTFPGCNDPAACNYVSGAGCNDGSCTYPGCTNPTACNFMPTAGCDNGTCTLPGCINPAACNFNINAGCDDGSCTYPGCNDPAACNYVATAGCSDGSCTYPGCTNPAACNYMPTAGCDNGSCTLPGCINPAACNFNINAGCDDGSCTYPGCIDPAACNYVATAGCSDGSCTYPGCNDPGACNYDMNAGCNNGSCDYSCLGCYGDFDDNGVINTSDLLLLMASFGCASGCGEFDLDNNGPVNTGDMLLFFAVFGTVCP